MTQFFTMSTGVINTTPLDIAGNRQLVMSSIRLAASAGSRLLLLPELCLTGYGCEDVFYVQSFLKEAMAALESVVREMPGGIAAAIGVPVLAGGQLYNGCALVSRGGIHGIALKQYLARTGIHYENRWFTPWKAGETCHLDDLFQDQRAPVPAGDICFDIGGVKIGFEICEDSWVAHRPGTGLYARGVDIILNPSASHFAIGKQAARRNFIQDGSRAFCCVYAYTNLLGNESGRAIYDGDSIIASCGQIIHQSSRLSFKTHQVHTVTVDLEANRNSRLLSSENICHPDQGLFVKVEGIRPSQAEEAVLSSPAPLPEENPEQIACQAVALGMWDFMRKTRTGGFALSLSGGADSALCGMMAYYAMVLAAEHLGAAEFIASLKSCGISLVQSDSATLAADFVKREVMPKVLITLYQGSEHSGEVTRKAAEELAKGIGARHYEWKITSLVNEYQRLVNDLLPEGDKLSWEKDDATLQNIQARARSPGIWMLANRFNKLLVATSNLSEASVGYCTMDGDTSGVLSPIAGISKSRILKINRYIMEHGLETPCGLLKIPEVEGIVQQAPTAELRPVEQTDESDLMPYPLLDEIRRLTQTLNLWPKDVLTYLKNGPFGRDHDTAYLVNALKKYYRLYCRNQWKRERFAVGFHIEGDSADPKSFRRFPVLSSQMRQQLEELDRL
ncbi:MAG: NAD(+) synthase [Succinivibrionaceae bacterium]|nr:NAD(+) synthase [Succinivibrionaceae bacterium]